MKRLLYILEKYNPSNDKFEPVSKNKIELYYFYLIINTIRQSENDDLPYGWKWSSEWTYVNNNYDSSGWLYSSFLEGQFGPYKPGLTYRERKWIRPKKIGLKEINTKLLMHSNISEMVLKLESGHFSAPISILKPTEKYKNICYFNFHAVLFH